MAITLNTLIYFAVEAQRGQSFKLYRNKETNTSISSKIKKPKAFYALDFFLNVLTP